MNTILEKLYKYHQVKPFISPDRDIEAWLLGSQTCPKTKYGTTRRQSPGRRYYPPLENSVWYFYH